MYKNTSLFIKYIVIAATAFLSACGGGGGGGGSAAPTPYMFTSWSAVQPNSIVQASGPSTSFNYSANSTTGAVRSIVSNGFSTSNILLTYGNGDLNLSGIQIQFGGCATCGTATVNPGETIRAIGSGPVPSLIYGINQARTTEILGINAPSYGWNYQTYGVWVTGEGTGSGTAGAVSAGSATPVTGMPSTGTAIFTGNTIGIWAATGLPAYATAANMTANVNFGSRSLGFSTSGTVASSFNGGGAFSAPGLNMSGVATFQGSSSFSGPVSTASGMSGSIVGQFYGPNANEIGGTYNLMGGGSSMGGGFGGKR